MIRSREVNVVLQEFKVKRCYPCLEMAKNVDVVVDPFRPGVMKSLIRADVLCADNLLIFARMTGWGQSGDPAYVDLQGTMLYFLGGTPDLFRRGDEIATPETLLTIMLGRTMLYGDITRNH